LVYNTPWGWAFIYTLLLTMAYLFIGGQRLGRPRPLPRAVLTRNPAEYVVSMANLFRRAGKRGIGRGAGWIVTAPDLGFYPSFWEMPRRRAMCKGSLVRGAES
jgi:hypothetical protein